MQIVWCLGGLGNQMFQYAFYRALELSGKESSIDISQFDEYSLHNGYELKRVFNLMPRLAIKEDVHKLRQGFVSKVLRKFKLRDSVVSVPFEFNPRYLTLRGDKYLIGYWQSEKYFAEYESQIRNDFTFPSLDDANQAYANLIKNSNSVALHIRMGDYVNHPLHGGICTPEYYQQAIDLIQQKTEAPRYFIFSNDVTWCKNNLGLSGAVYIEGNEGENSFRDMQLMSLCRHNIIANSSFSWWGAWLNNFQDKTVIAPEKWFNDANINTEDLIPNSWITI